MKGNALIISLLIGVITVFVGWYMVWPLVAGNSSTSQNTASPVATATPQPQTYHLIITLTKDTTRKQLDGLLAETAALRSLRRYEHITPQEAYTNFKVRYASQSGIMAYLQVDFFTDSVEVDLTNLGEAETFAATVARYPFVDSVDTDFTD